MKDSVRAKRRFNVFDAIIIIFIVLCIVAVWFKYYYNNKINSDFVNVEVTFISPSVLQSTADAMKAGKVVSEQRRQGSRSHFERVRKSVGNIRR